MRFIVAALCLCLGLAQGQVNGRAFEVTSVKAHQPGSGYAQLSCANGRFITRGSPLTNTIEWAYDLPFYQFIEMEEKAPQWVAQDGFDIEATAGRPVPESECRLMLQSLLADRFKLAVHRGTKEGQSYDLVVARGGPKLEKVTDADKGRGVYFTVNGVLPQYLPGVDPERGLTMEQLAYRLSLYTNRIPVRNQTRLEGLYKINLKFTLGLGVDGGSDPTLEIAVERQLGLRLEEHKGPVETFVVDSISRPSAN